MRSANWSPRVKPSNVDERALRRHFYLPDMPDPDLVHQHFR